MQVFTPRKSRAVLALAAAALFSASHRCMADTIAMSESSTPSTALAPSSDTISLNAGSGAYDTSSGPFVFQTGDFVVGDSPIADQIIPFSIQDQITLNGITQSLTIFGQDNVTSAADELTIFASDPVTFGNELFQLQQFDTVGYDIGGDLPIDLQATVTPAVTPEPAALWLLGTALLGLVALAKRKGLPNSNSGSPAYSAACSDLPIS